MQQLPQLPLYGGGKLATTQITDRIAAAVNGLSPVHHVGQADESVSPYGGFWGRVERTGVNGDEDDFPDDRYWIRSVRITNDETSPADDSVTWKKHSTAEQDYQLVVASNLAEGLTRGHVLPYGQVVWVTPLIDAGDPQRIRYVFSVGTPHIWIRITSATVISGTTNRWAYNWVQSQYLRKGAHQDVPGGLTSADTTYGGLAYNTIEANNSAAGYQGNSINLSSLPAGYNLQPVQGSPIVRAYRVFTCDDPPVGEWLFSYENAVQGTCP